ncbi:MAG TPA: trypsin-like peptidase domain-containing protein [Bacillota bacterium]|nr:trypsin-like peptidase domain-containing protein [Bacillota bacterium]HPQ62466.1 trypsin-like peptidase domain-containing protein [Bacillota bacterium]
MKKYLVLGILAFTFFALTACTGSGFIFGNLAEVATTTLTTTTQETTTTEDSTFAYTDYESLKQALYDQVYADLYAELYADIESALFNEDDSEYMGDLYEEIYASVANALEDSVASGEIDILLDTTQSKIYNVASLVQKSVVGITSYLDTEGQSLGSGVVYRYDENTDTYYLITNHHVVEDGDNYKIVFCDGSKVVGTLLGANEDVDIAVLSFRGTNLEYDIEVSPLGDSSQVEVGMIVLAAGNPEGYNFYGSLTMGILSGLDRSLSNSTALCLQHDAPINPGNSGGPLYNLDGEVIGINVSKLVATDIEGMGFSIPINTVKTIVNTIAPTN